ncbi:class I SAM-dependent methyltransferase [Solitalea koreensis]|uniref:Ubiquinone/menaquinone biosynthesis C-methylase UbiE n=1 Tax=Solitalea koreensis TaxID=543615 RepID=A0A521C1S3_9SPHI|nr:class I SAM-dependent methyltransferase [Solitalea koreensis]SMO53338.1 Ubiquinone/menaquinone biosynthesis C-methylase UbiE [Solitalea koreensis]
MDAQLQKRIQRYGWDKAASYYEQYWQQQLEPAQTELLNMIVPGKGEYVLDVACGTGLLDFKISEMVGSSGKVHGTDISEGMIEIAKKSAKDLGINTVSFERMEAEELNIINSKYDIALCSLGLMYVPDAQKAIQELFRVLKPGGRAGVAVWGKRSNCGWAEIFPIVDKRVTSDVCPLFFQLGTGNTLQLVLKNAGFINIVSKRINTILHYASKEEACKAAFIGGPVAMAYSRFTEETKKEAHKEYIHSIKSFKKRNNYFIPGEFVITMGYKS